MHRIFLPHEASLVLGIPLSLRKPPDRKAWSCTPSGNLSTSNTHKLLTASASKNIASTSNQDAQRKFQKGVWQMRVPNKIKHFIWRVFKNALPTKCNLMQCHITDSNLCEQCKEASEDSLHALCFCSQVAPVWQASQWFQTMISPPPLDFCDLLNRFLQVHDDLKTEIFAVTSWCIWNRPIALHFGRSAHPISRISSEASSMHQEFIAVQNEEPPRPPRDHGDASVAPSITKHHKSKFRRCYLQTR